MKLTWWEERACINTSASTFRFCNFGRPPTQISHLFKCFNLKFVGIISYSQPNYDKWSRKNLQNLQKKIIFHNKSAPYTNWELATKYNHLGQFFKKKYYHLGQFWKNNTTTLVCEITNPYFLLITPSVELMKFSLEVIN